MIQIKIARMEGKISFVSMHGHADYDQYGKDIVCSAASTIIIGGINAIAKLGFISFISYSVDTGDVEVKINNTESTEKKRTKMINEIKRLNNYSLDYGINNHTGVLDK